MSTTKPVGCRACGTALSYSTYTGPQFSNQNDKYNVKRIENTVRVPSSEYTMNKSALNVYTSPKSQFAYVNWNQMSDRAVPGITHSNVPSHGNSTRQLHLWLLEIFQKNNKLLKNYYFYYFLCIIIQFQIFIYTLHYFTCTWTWECCWSPPF